MFSIRIRRRARKTISRQYFVPGERLDRVIRQHKIFCVVAQPTDFVLCNTRLNLPALRHQ